MSDKITGDMPKAYDPRAVEAAIHQMWMDKGYFKPVPNPGRDPFCIILPPPNVTGELHLGHALTVTIEDALIRWHRMLGDPTLWVPGVDHAGIATQNVVEKQLGAEGMSRHDLGREKFEARVWQWVGQIRSRIAIQHMKLGASADWDREVFTLDEGPQRAVRETFARLYKDGLIYRGERITNWCPRCQTALSDLEVDHVETQGSLWYVRYPLLDDAGNRTDEYIVVATTRPETIVGDTGVAVNSDDDRWKKFIGRTALLPVIERHIPIVADESVETEFGTGAVKVTPGHDPNDFEIGARHDLPVIVAMDAEARMNENAGPLAGLDRYIARKTIVADLERMGLVEKRVDHAHAVGHCSRCDTVVEPIASTQWFVRTEPLAKPAIEAVKDGRIEILPRRFERTYMHWMENIRDWCISRQLWWGHRIPVWYCTCGELTVAVTDPTECPKCGDTNLEQDPDVLDTWFSSGLWPFSTLGWPEDTEDLRTFYPTSVLETGYDILFFWVARMIMLGMYVTGEVPFRHVYLHGLIRDSKGQKMTKSRGNVVDPLEITEKYGTDAARFTFATGGGPGNDFRLFDDKLESSRNFANKLWNASRFVVQSIGDETVSLPQNAQTLTDRSAWPLEDRWIVSRSISVAAEVNQYLADFQINEGCRVLYDFVWSEYCDWYLEMAKIRLKDGDRSPLPVLAYVLQKSLRLIHPMMPFVTETIWQHLRDHVDGLEEALITAAFPLGEGAQDPEAEGQIDALMDVVRAIRNIRAERGVDPAKFVEAYVVADGVRPTIENGRQIVEVLARARPLHVIADTAEAPGTQVAAAVLAQTHVLIPLAGLLDVGAEREKLNKQMDEARAEVQRLQQKLGNEQFRSKAPDNVIAKEEEKLAGATSRLEGLEKRLSELA